MNKSNGRNRNKTIFGSNSFLIRTLKMSWIGISIDLNSEKTFIYDTKGKFKVFTNIQISIKEIYNKIWDLQTNII